MTLAYEQRSAPPITAERPPQEALDFHIPTPDDLAHFAHPDMGDFIPPQECDTHKRICDNLVTLREFQLTPIPEQINTPEARAHRRKLVNTVIIDACKLAGETLPPDLQDTIPQDSIEIEAEVSARSHSASLVEIELVLLSWGTVRDPDLAMASRMLLDEYGRQLDARDVAENDPERRHFELLRTTFDVTMERTKVSGHKSDIFNNYRSLVELSTTSSSASNPDYLKDTPKAYSEMRAPLGKRILTRLGIVPAREYEREETELERAYNSTDLNEVLGIYFKISPETPYDSLALITNLYRRLDQEIDLEARHFVAELTADAAEKVLNYCQPTNYSLTENPEVPGIDQPNIRAVFGVIDAIDIATQPGRTFTDWQQGRRLINGLETLVDNCIEQKFSLSTDEDPSMLEPVRKALKEYRLDSSAVSLTERVAKYAHQADELLQTKEAARMRTEELRQYKEHVSSLVTAIRTQVKAA